MYGLVNRAIEELVITNYGEPVWESIKLKAGLDVDLFISGDPYPDDITYKLVGAASEILGAPPEQILEAFGEFWVVYTAKEGYGRMFEAGGASLREFLLNLPDFHSAVGILFPQLNPPIFASSPGPTSTSVNVEYYSTRDGLAPMVVGLLRGIGRMFQTDVTIEPFSLNGERPEFATQRGFSVSWGA